MKQKLHIIIGSTRPGRVAPAFAEWVLGIAQENGKFDPLLVDLAEFNLPMYDEPKHPRMGQYEKEHTRAWSASVRAADAFVVVTPEYNYFAPPALVNAITYLSPEWAYKPAAFVSYGGQAGGLRAVQAEKQLLTTMKVMPIPEGVAIPMFAQYIGPDGRATPNEAMVNAAKLMLDELHRWSTALKTMRTA